jgi:hypothetical protein
VAKAYDIASMHLHSFDAKLNLAYKESWSKEAPVLPRLVVGHHEAREDREVRKRLEAELANEVIWRNSAASI